MKLSIVIPTSRSKSEIEGTVAACLAQEPGEHEVEVIVVTNPPNFEIDALIEDLRPSSRNVSLRVLHNQELGVNKARNRGMEDSSGDFVYFIDDDCVLPDPSHAVQIIKAHDELPEVDGLGGLYISPQDCSKPCEFYNSLMEVWLRANQTDQDEQLTLLGGNACYKKRVFEDGTGFDGDIISGGDETEFNHRLVRARRRLCLSPRANLVHDFKGNWRSMFGRAWKQGKGRGRNPHQDAIQRCKARRNPLRFLKTRPHPMFAFAFFVLLYRVVVQIGHVYASLYSSREPARG